MRQRRRKREIRGRGVQRGEIIPSSTAEQGAAARNLLLLLRLFLGTSNVTAAGKMLKFFSARDDDNESLLGAITEGEPR